MCENTEICVCSFSFFLFFLGADNKAYMLAYISTYAHTYVLTKIIRLFRMVQYLSLSLLFYDVLWHSPYTCIRRILNK